MIAIGYLPLALRSASSGCPALRPRPDRGMAVPPGSSDNTGGDSYRFPWWWFVVLCMPNFTIHFISNPLWGLIWPNMLAQMSGQKYKALVLAATTQIGVVCSYFSPLIGSLSDKLPNHYARRFGGRRRPFIIFGCLLGAGGIAMTVDSMYRIIALGTDGTKEQFVIAYLELALSIVIGCVGGIFEMSPWVAIIPDTVAPVQRGECIMIVSWCNTILQLGGGGLAYVVGQKMPCFGRDPCLSVREVRDRAWMPRHPVSSPTPVPRVPLWKLSDCT
eukprot:SAG31_NODE_4101_length_3583_cov_1.895522_1_plen_274_part_00